MYAQRPSRFPGAVVWERTGAVHGTHRVLPDGCMDLIWREGELIVTGPDTRAHLTPDRPGARCTGLRFAPGTAPAVLGIPASELRDQRVPLSALWRGGTARRLAERVGEAADPAAALERIAMRYGRDAGRPDPVLAATVAALGAGSTVTALAEALGLGERRLHRRCLTAFGYGPKTLARVLRLQRALGLARRGLLFAEVAAVAGYADQAHLAREVRALASVPLGELIHGRAAAVPALSAGHAPQAPAGSGAKRSTALPSGSRTEA